MSRFYWAWVNSTVRGKITLFVGKNLLFVEKFYCPWEILLCTEKFKLLSEVYLCLENGCKTASQLLKNQNSCRTANFHKQEIML